MAASGSRGFDDTSIPDGDDTRTDTPADTFGWTVPVRRRTGVRPGPVRPLPVRPMPVRPVSCP